MNIMPNIKIVKKNIKNIILRVKPNGEVMLSVPNRTSDEYIAGILKEKESWIQMKLAIVAQKVELEKKDVQDKKFKFLGQHYPLKIMKSKEEEVKFTGEVLELYLKNPNSSKRKNELIERWYREQSLIYFDDILNKYKQIVKKEVNIVRIKRMKTKWGSCNPHKGYINLNLELITKPTICIEYVIFHELSHLIHPNHSKAFYDYMALYMSDHKERRKILNAP